MVLLILRKAQLAAPCLTLVHLHPFPVPSLGAGAAQACGVGAVFIFPITAKVGLGLQFGSSLATTSLAGRSLRTPQAQWWWWCWWWVPHHGLGTPRASFPAFPMPGSFSHWMAALEQGNVPGRPCRRGDLLPKRLFSLVIWRWRGLLLG